MATIPDVPLPDEHGAIARALSVDAADLPLVLSVFTPYQLLFVERLCGLIAPRPLLLLDSRPEAFRRGREPRLPAETIALALTGKVNDARQAALVRQGAAAVDRFAGGAPFGFLNASFQWPINNVVYTRHRRDPNAHFFLIEDGLSSYLEIRPSWREAIRNVGREAVARLRGFPRRRRIPGHPLGLDVPEIEAIFLGAERMPGGPGHRRYFTVPHRADRMLAPGDGSALFVGQPYLKTYGEPAMRRFLAAAAAWLRADGIGRIAFKPHHYQDADEVLLYADAGFEVVNPPLTVEEMIADSPFRTIAAINSTALLTTRSLFGGTIRAIAFSPTRFRPAHERRRMSELEAVFAQAGVEIVDLGNVLARDPG